MPGIGEEGGTVCGNGHGAAGDKAAAKLADESAIERHKNPRWLKVRHRAQRPHDGGNCKGRAKSFSADVSDNHKRAPIEIAVVLIRAFVSRADKKEIAANFFGGPITPSILNPGRSTAGAICRACTSRAASNSARSSRALRHARRAPAMTAKAMAKVDA